MIFFIHYRPDDGEIIGWGNGFEPEPIEGMAVARVEPFDPDPAKHKFDGKAVIEKTPEEMRRARLPTLRQVQQAVFAELCRTDAMVMPDRPVAVTWPWAKYRQALRELSNLVGPIEMVNAWPAPPDGTDPVIHLREGL